MNFHDFDAIRFHKRNRQEVECEVYNQTPGSISHMTMRGIVTTKSRNSVTVYVPTATSTKHVFSTTDRGDGYGYERLSRTKKHMGWRIRLDQLKEAEIPHVDSKEPDDG